MTRSSEPGDPLVVDASLAVWSVVPAAAAVDTLGLIGDWRSRGLRLVAPDLLLAEGTSAIRRLVHSGLLSMERGAVALEDLFDLAIDCVPPNAERCRAAARWAERLGQAKAYDGFYMALAEELTAELWTADRSLARAARERSLAWVRWAGERDGRPL
jgi:predicted nucleic acid-binding protein